VMRWENGQRERAGKIGQCVRDLELSNIRDGTILDDGKSKMGPKSGMERSVGGEKHLDCGQGTRKL
jgi:hypothetical protein